MKIIFALGLFLAAAPAFEMKPCEELKSEIAAKLDAKGVKGYQLEIIAASDVKARTVVGSCEGGTKKITYTRGDGVAPPPAPKK